MQSSISVSRKRQVFIVYETNRLLAQAQEQDALSEADFESVEEEDEGSGEDEPPQKKQKS